MVSLAKVSDRSVGEIIKRDGKIVYVSHMTVSDDGKSITVKTEDKERGTTTTYVMTKK